MSPLVPTYLTAAAPPLGTSTSPVRADSDVGELMLKLPSMGLGPDALVREWIGTQAAGGSGLTVFDHCIYQLSETDAALLRAHRCSAAAGDEAFATRYAPDFAPWDGTSATVRTLASPSDVGLLVFVDTWVSNGDRVDRNGAARLDNFGTRAAADDQRRWHAFDFSECLKPPPGELSLRLARIEHIHSRRVSGAPGVLADAIDAKGVARAADAAQAWVDSGGLGATLAAIPASWGCSREVLNAVERFMRERLTFLRRNLDLFGRF